MSNTAPRRQAVFAYHSTFRQKKGEASMVYHEDQTLLSKVGAPNHWDLHYKNENTGAGSKLSQIFDWLKIIAHDYDDIIFILGTDSLEEMAFALDQFERPNDKNIIITGAMRPSDQLCYDGLQNLKNALLYIEKINDLGKKAPDLGVVVTMHNQLYSAQDITKIHSTSLNAFQTGMSENAPVLGHFEGSELLLKGTSLPPLKRLSPQSFIKNDRDLNTPNIGLFTATMDSPPPAIDIEAYDGFVLAGMGTGSLSQAWINFFEPIAQEKPVLITSRCLFGRNYDDACYMGSLAKYEDKGFLLEPYRYLNPYQARLRLMVEMIAERAR